MSTLFSSTSAITSRAERYRLPARTSDSNRGVLLSLTGETTRLSMWNGRSSGPANGRPGDSRIDISGVCANEEQVSARTTTGMIFMKCRKSRCNSPSTHEQGQVIGISGLHGLVAVRFRYRVSDSGSEISARHAVRCAAGHAGTPPPPDYEPPDRWRTGAIRNRPASPQSKDNLFRPVPAPPSARRRPDWR